MRFVETYRAVVDPSHCDHLGHMNVSRYFKAVSDGMFAFQTNLGLGLSDVKEGRKLSFAVVRAESDFKSEIIEGEVIALQTAIEEVGNRSAVFRHRLIKVEDNTIAFETRFRCVLLDLEKRKASVIPDDIRRKASEYIASENS